MSNYRLIAESFGPMEELAQVGDCFYLSYVFKPEWVPQVLTTTCRDVVVQGCLAHGPDRWVLYVAAQQGGIVNGVTACTKHAGPRLILSRGLDRKMD